MPGVEIRMKDGTVRSFPYPSHTSYEGVFVVVHDERERTHAFPAADIAEVIVTPRPRW